MNRYENIVSSGDEIIGNIPNHWTLKPLRYIAELSDKKNDDGIERRMLSVSQYFGIIEKEYENDEQRRSEEESANYWVVEDQNLVANTMWLNYCGIGVSRGIEGYVSPAYRVYRLDTQIVEPRFIHYLMRSDLYVGIYTKHLKGIRPNSLQVSTYDFKHINMILPPLEEQKQISRYLDRKTDQIDSLIGKIQKKIELLKEQRTSLINQCVTKGLNPNVEMKDSGVEWIGEIPKHWDIQKLAVLGQFSKGKNITKGDLTEVGNPVILYSHIYTTYDRVTTIPRFFISDETSQLSTKINGNTFLFTSSGESVEEIGKTLLYKGDEQVSVGGDAIIFTLNNIGENDPEFLSFSFNSKTCQDQKSSMSRGEIVVHVYEKQLREVCVCIPPSRSEQIEIRHVLNRNDATTTELIDKLNQRVDLLKEYRQALISSVVTGKVRVTEDMV